MEDDQREMREEEELVGRWMIYSTWGKKMGKQRTRWMREEILEEVKLWFLSGKLEG